MEDWDAAHQPGGQKQAEWTTTFARDLMGAFDRQSSLYFEVRLSLFCYSCNGWYELQHLLLLNSTLRRTRIHSHKAVPILRFPWTTSSVAINGACEIACPKTFFYLRLRLRKRHVWKTSREARAEKFAGWSKGRREIRSVVLRAIPGRHSIPRRRILPTG
jgi:hypothetical protein